MCVCLLFHSVETDDSCVPDKMKVLISNRGEGYNDSVAVYPVTRQ